MSIRAIIGNHDRRAGYVSNSGKIELKAESEPVDFLRHRFSLRVERRVILLDEDDISFIRAEANYVRVFVAGESYRFRRSLGEICERLDSRKFARVHRSIIVNLTKVKQLEPCNSGEYLILLQDGTTVPSSRRYRHALRPLLARFL